MTAKLPLPRGCKRRLFTAFLARAARGQDRATRLQAQMDRLGHEIALLQEELRTKNGRPQRRKSTARVDRRSQVSRFESI